MSTTSDSSLLEANLPADPYVLFTQWFLAAEAAQLPEPSAMALATATAAGVPSVRMVLLRGFDERGFGFYTNYESRKAGELAENPQAALVLYWASLARQIRIEGQVEKIAPVESDAYFRSRPFGHRLGALVSPQSQVIVSRQFLDERLQALEAQYVGQTDVPRPPHWGGYRVKPHTIEFWQGRLNRLHDRLRYRKTETGWAIDRLAP